MPPPPSLSLSSSCISFRPKQKLKTVRAKQGWPQIWVTTGWVMFIFRHPNVFFVVTIVVWIKIKEKEREMLANQMLHTHAFCIIKWILLFPTHRQTYRHSSVLDIHSFVMCVWVRIFVVFLICARFIIGIWLKKDGFQKRLLNVWTVTYAWSNTFR